jgi:hypothetical protein
VCEREEMRRRLRGLPRTHTEDGVAALAWRGWKRVRIGAIIGTKNPRSQLLPFGNRAFFFLSHYFPLSLSHKTQQETGECPVTKTPLTLDDLLAIKANKAVKPKPAVGAVQVDSP